MKMIRDKGKGNVSYYVEEGIGLCIECFTKNNAGYIKSWGLAGPDFHLQGESQMDFMDKLKWLVKHYDLKVHSKHSKDLVIIYVNNLNYIRGFFHKYITEDFQFYVQIGLLEFRPIDIWDDSLKDEYSIQKYADFLIKEVFNYENYYYITPNQIPRRHIAKAYDGETLAQKIFPERYYDYKYMHNAVFGGFYYMPNKKMLITEPMIGLDLVSAYIYCLLIEKHCCSAFTEIDPEGFEAFIGMTTKVSIGTYKLHYTTFSKKIQCYKDIFEHNLEKGNHEVIIRLTNVDLKIITELVTVLDLECMSLYEADVDYLPEEVRDVIVDEYIKKQIYKETGDKRLKVQKPVVNGIYGDTIRTINDEKEFIDRKKNATLAPQWGCFCTSYCKKLLLSLASKVDGWMLSATDSVYCFDTPKNRQLIEEINSTIKANVKEFCDKFDYDYSRLQNLGTFKKEAEIVKFKAYSYGRYAYLTKDGELVIKASGCNKDQLPQDESIFDLDDLPTGTRQLPRYTKEETRCTVDGKEYVSYGSYWEYETKSSAETDLLDVLCLLGL